MDQEENLCSTTYPKDEMALQHQTYARLATILPTQVKSYFVFSFVRNPWDRAISDYFWSDRGFPSFELFLKHIELLYETYGWKNLLSYEGFAKENAGHYFPQNYFLGSRTTIYRFENFPIECQRLFKRLNITSIKEIPVINKSKHGHYSQYYNEETKRIIFRLYGEDITRFGYKF